MPDFVCLDTDGQAVLVIEAFSPEEAAAFYRGLEDGPKLSRIVAASETPAGRLEESFGHLMGSEKGKVAARGREGASMLSGPSWTLSELPRVRASSLSSGAPRRVSEVAAAGQLERSFTRLMGPGKGHRAAEGRGV